MTQWVYTKEIRIDFDNFILDKGNHNVEMRDAYWNEYLAGYKELADKGEAFPGFKAFPVAMALRDIVGNLINISESSTITNFTRISIFQLTHTYSQAVLLKDVTTQSYINLYPNIILENAEITEVNIPIDPTTSSLYGFYVSKEWDKYDKYNFPLESFKED